MNTTVYTNFRRVKDNTPGWRAVGRRSSLFLRESCCGNCFQIRWLR